MKIRNWIIKKLGGITKDEQEETRLRHEKWAIEHLTGKNGEIIPDCSVYNPFHGDDILVLKSRIRIIDGRIKGLKIAPWCKDIVTFGLIMY